MIERNILDIQLQRYSTLLADYFICEYCHYVDRTLLRAFVGYKCGVCKKPQDGGVIYFSSSVTYLLNLMQEAYHSKFYIQDEMEDKIQEKSTNTHHLSIVLFFTTLREVLIQKLLDELFYISGIPKIIYERLLSDNRLYSQKQDKLFQTMTSYNWDDAIKQANLKDEIDYLKLNDFLKYVVKARNEFLHKGYDFLITKELAENCVMNISPLLNLYVCFHNDFVHPYYLKKCI